MEIYRIYDDASIYFVTYSVVGWLPVFVSERTCGLLAESLAFCHAHKGLRVNAYVMMPTHMHAIVFDHQYDADRLRQTLDEFRRYTGRALADDAIRNQPRVFSDVYRQTARPDRHRRFWQPTRHPVAVRTERFWRQKLDYIHGNPVRKGLVRYPEDWRYSSARSYATGESTCDDVEITQISW